MPKISVIIPVYNAEKHLEKCINSVLAQTFTDFECILINDGSLDNSGKICDYYVKNDKRIKVIHKKNTGPAEARHFGINIAEAELLHFIDSDDWIFPFTLELLYKKQQETGADIVIEKGVNYIYPNKQKIILLPDVYPDIIPLVYFFQFRCKGHWSKIYKKLLFHGIYYPPKSPAEDFITNTQVFSKVSCGSLAQIDNIVYNYTVNESKTRTSFIDYYTEFNKPFNESPVYPVMIWIKNFLENSQYINNDLVFSAFNYLMVIKCVIPYFRYSNFVTKKEAKLLYRQYYKNCSNKENIPFHNIILIKLFTVSLFLSKCYRYFCYTILIKIKYFILNIVFDIIN